MSAAKASSERRIAILLPSLKFGGAERVALNLGKALERAGYQVDFVLMSAQGELLGEARSQFRVIDLACSRTWKLPGLLARYLVRTRPVAVISSFWKLNLCACIARAAHPSGKLGLWEHSPPSRSVNSPVRWYKPSASILYRLATRVVAVSNGVADDVRGATVGLGRRIVTIYNPIPAPDAIDPAARIANHVMWIGRFADPKNPLLMIEAFARLPRDAGYRLSMVGDGEMRPLLEQRVRALGLPPSVTFLGFRDDVDMLLGTAAVLALTSDREGLPTVLIEALHHACGIVATDCGEGVSEILGCGTFGTIVPVGDASALATAIEREASLPRDGETQRGAAARFAPERIAAQFLGALGLAAAPADGQ